MDELEIKKIEYQNLYKITKKISKDLENIIYLLYMYKQKMSEILIVDDKFYKEETFLEIETKYKKVKDEMDKQILPIIESIINR